MIEMNGQNTENPNNDDGISFKTWKKYVQGTS